MGGDTASRAGLAVVALGLQGLVVIVIVGIVIIELDRAASSGNEHGQPSDRSSGDAGSTSALDPRPKPSQAACPEGTVGSKRRAWGRSRWPGWPGWSSRRREPDPEEQRDGDGVGIAERHVDHGG